MDVVLKKDKDIVFEDLDDGEGLRTLVLKAGDLVPVDIVTDALIKEYEILEQYKGKYFIDLDKLLPDYETLIEDVEQLMLEYDELN